MALRYRLVTYTCLHFDIQSTTLTASPFSHDHTLHGLWNKSTSNHVANHWPCHRPECRIIDNWPTRIVDAVQNIKDYLESSATKYIEMGNRYHEVSIAIRAKEAPNWDSLPSVRLAHEQLSINSGSWWEDPFFTRWHAISDLLHEIGVGGLDTQEMVSAINECRANIGRVEGEMQKLIEGVKMLEWTESQPFDWGTKAQRPKSARKKTLYLQPMVIFGNVVYRKWKSRMEGFATWFASSDSDDIF